MAQGDMPQRKYQRYLHIPFIVCSSHPPPSSPYLATHCLTTLLQWLRRQTPFSCMFTEASFLIGHLCPVVRELQGMEHSTLSVDASRLLEAMSISCLVTLVLLRCEAFEGQKEQLVPRGFDGLLCNDFSGEFRAVRS